MYTRFINNIKFINVMKLTLFNTHSKLKTTKVATECRIRYIFKLNL